MASPIWIAAAAAVSQVNTITVAGTPATSQIYNVTINGKTISYTAIVSDANADIAIALAALLAACTYPEFTEVTWANPSSAVITGTATTAGLPFTQTSSASGTGTLTTVAGIATPVNAAFTDTGTGGTLAFATTYYYRVTAINAAGETLASTETSKATANDAANTHKITVAWTIPAGTGITGFRIYGRSTGAELLMATVGATATSWIDDGSVTPSGALPVLNTTVNSGPNDISCPANYSAGVFPAASDTLYLTQTNQGLLYNGNGLVCTGTTLAALIADSTFTGAVGLPLYNASGYFEYRPTFLLYPITALTIGGGTGSGSAFMRFNFGSVQTAVTVLAAGQPSTQGLPAVYLKGTHASNTLTILQGVVGVAVEPADVSTFLTIKLGFADSPASDVTLYLGSGVTWTTLTQNGGTVYYASSGTTHNMRAGKAVVTGGTVNLTTADIESGTLDYRAAGTITTLTAGLEGTADFSRATGSPVVTNATIYGALLDPDQRVTYTNPVSFPIGIGSGGASLDWGLKFSLARS